MGILYICWDAETRYRKDAGNAADCSVLQVFSCDPMMNRNQWLAAAISSHNTGLCCISLAQEKSHIQNLKYSFY